MGYDIKYDAGADGPDNIMGADNNYEQAIGVVSKVGRSVVARHKEIDGEGFGNKAWAELERDLDTPSNRQLLVYHTEQALAYLVRSKEISGLDVSTGNVSGIRGVGLLVKFTDMRTGNTATLGFISPWGDL